MYSNLEKVIVSPSVYENYLKTKGKTWVEKRFIKDEYVPSGNYKNRQMSSINKIGKINYGRTR